MVTPVYLTGRTHLLRCSLTAIPTFEVLRNVIDVGFHIPQSSMKPMTLLKRLMI